MPSAADIVKAHRYVLLAKSWCPDVKYASNVLQKYKVYSKFHVVELDKLPQNEASVLEKEFTQLAGRKWVPSLFIDGKFWGTEGDLKALESHDETKDALQKIGLLG